MKLCCLTCSRSDLMQENGARSCLGILLWREHGLKRGDNDGQLALRWFCPLIVACGP
jgi:hypothetical protein